MKLIDSLLIGMIIFTLSTPVFAFTDLMEGNKYSDAVFFLEEKGVLEGYADGEIKVNRLVTRAEFLKMVLDYNEEQIGNETGCFEDVKSHWSENYVCYAKNKGWVNGYDAQHFIPSRKVNLAEAAKIITNVVFPHYFLDESQENEDWFYRYVDFLDEREVDVCEVNSYGEFLTRGMMAELLYKVELSKGISHWDLDSGKCIKIGESYQDLGMDYFKYRGDVYFAKYDRERLHLADFDSFERFHLHYSKDKDRVYLGEKVVDGADPDTFDILYYNELEDRAFATDINNVYYGTILLEGIDVDTFEIINGSYIKDFNGVYYLFISDDVIVKKVDGADPETFELLHQKYRFGKDKNNVYYGVHLIEMADNASIEVVGNDYSNFYYANQYAKDKNYVYCGDDIFAETENFKLLEGANPDTFELVSMGDYRLEARDGDMVYEDCELVE
ncbi:hypothetical protein GF354_00445 [Candidatus Peregrinibacteria bacterium]|nr:hypothetical protein [Candidatus Peregrinibacteria bacterium]